MHSPGLHGSRRMATSMEDVWHHGVREAVRNVAIDAIRSYSQPPFVFQLDFLYTPSEHPWKGSIDSLNAAVSHNEWGVNMTSLPRISTLATLCCTLALCFLGCRQETSPSLAAASTELSHFLDDADLQNVGEKIFFDKDLSTPPGQACAACHGPAVGWTGPDEELNKKGSVYSGSIHTRFGNRKPNSSAYATLTPAFHAVHEGKTVRFVGGDFWDGRATGWKLGNPAADQAEGPFLNPVEQNNPDARSVVRKIGESAYAEEFRGVVRRIRRSPTRSCPRRPILRTGSSPWRSRHMNTRPG